MCRHGGHEEAQYHLRISESWAQVPVHWLTAFEGTQLVYWPQAYGESAELEQQPSADMAVLKKHIRPFWHDTGDSAPVSLSTST